MNQNDTDTLTDSVGKLLNEDGILSAAAARLALAGLEPGSQITYLLWDLHPSPEWLPSDHPKSPTGSLAARPLYLGKSAGTSRLKSHLAKDGFGSGLSKITTHAWKNPGLLSYCLGKRQAGWLGVTFINHGVGLEADDRSEALERAGVEAVGWRRDVGGLRNARRLADPEGLAAFYEPVHVAPVPLAEGLLLNQTCPKPDGRKIRFG
ncbi:hypothetical protein [Brevundimonas sp.]|uniref:hypothetical protein n=1 Tax=Brevundimonas sp. TaxID=1871086 RepID=UPI003566933C